MDFKISLIDFFLPRNLWSNWESWLLTLSDRLWSYKTLNFFWSKKYCHHRSVGRSVGWMKDGAEIWNLVFVSLSFSFVFSALLSSSRCFVCFWFWVSAAITFRVTSVGKYLHGHSMHSCVWTCTWVAQFSNVRSKTVAQKDNGCTLWCVCLCMFLLVL